MSCKGVQIVLISMGLPSAAYTGPLVSSLEQWPSWNEARLASASLRCAVLEGGVTRDYALASSAQALLCKPAGGPAQWVCVLTEVQVGGGGVGEIKERWAGQSARPRQCSRQCVLRCMNCACACTQSRQLRCSYPAPGGTGAWAMAGVRCSGGTQVNQCQCLTASVTPALPPR